MNCTDSQKSNKRKKRLRPGLQGSAPQPASRVALPGVFLTVGLSLGLFSNAAFAQTSRHYTDLQLTPANAPKGRSQRGGISPIIKNPTLLQRLEASHKFLKPALGNDAQIQRERLQLKTYPYTYASAAAYRQALRQRDRMPQAGTSAASSNPKVSVNGVSKAATSAGNRVGIVNSSNQWYFLGPQNRTGDTGDLGYTTSLAGRVNAVAYDSNGTFYTATAGGGVWKFVRNFDGSYQSAAVTASDNSFPYLQTSSIAVNPGNPNELYVGLGDYNGFEGYGYGLGIMRSTNGGASWVNVGNGNLTSSALTGTLPTNTPIMDGTAVSAIVVDPDAPYLQLTATSGRGPNPGYIWYSPDNGNTWVQGQLASGGNVPAGNWSSLDYSVPDSNGNRYYYAALEGNGIYSSLDKGKTWTKLTVPLVYNVPANGTGGPDGTAVYGLKVAASKRSDSSGTLYVIDSSARFFDGKIFKSLDNGQTWVDLTGSYSSLSDPGNFINNNWYRADYALNLQSFEEPILQFSNDAGTISSSGSPLIVDTLYGSARTLQTAIGGFSFDGSDLYGPVGSVDTVPTLVPELGVQPNWEDIADAEYGVTHINIHGYQQDPTVSFTPSDPNTLESGIPGLTVNDGGVTPTVTYPGQFTADSQTQTPISFTSPQWNYPFVVGTSSDYNAALNISEFSSADFLYDKSGNLHIMGPTEENDGAFTDTGTLGQNSGSVPTGGWSTFQPLNYDGTSQPSWALVDDSPVFLPLSALPAGTTSNNPDKIPTNPSFYATPGIGFGDIDGNIDATAFDPFDPTGLTRFVTTTGLNNDQKANEDIYPTGKRFYYTTSGFAESPNLTFPGQMLGTEDITPDKNLVNQGKTYYFFNNFDPQNSVASAWEGEFRPRVGTPFAFGLGHQTTQFPPPLDTGVSQEDTAHFAVNKNNQFVLVNVNPVMYTGGQAVWRFSPPLDNLYPPQQGPFPKLTTPNRDRGAWQQVGQTLASGTDYITSIVTGGTYDENGNPSYNISSVDAFGNVTSSDPTSTSIEIDESTFIYAGTTNGTLWLWQYGKNNDGTEYSFGSATPTLVGNWKSFGTGNNLPANRPITAIAINTAQGQYGDVLVGFGGAASPNGTLQRLYRVANSLNGTPIFTNASGTISNTSFAYLPDVPINAIVRDPTDPTNIYYVANDVGVFVSTDAGSTWANATTPLGLPNVECTSLKIVAGATGNTLLVGTRGRGVWGFDTTNIVANVSQPNLVITPSFARTGSGNTAEIIATIKVQNTTDATHTSIGTAQNVLLYGATLTDVSGNPIPAYNGLATSAYVNPENTPASVVSATNPIKLGTIGSQPLNGVYPSQTFTLRFSAVGLRPGSAVLFQANGVYSVLPIPNNNNKVNTYATPSTGLRTRVP